MEKAEILESVVQFLQTGKEEEKGRRVVRRVLSRDQRQARARQHSYDDGVRSCLLRVSDFIASKSHESEETGGGSVRASLASAGNIHRIAAAGDPPARAPHLSGLHGVPHPYPAKAIGLPCDTRMLLSSTAAPTHITDPVWRPWPQ